MLEMERNKIVALIFVFLFLILFSFIEFKFHYLNLQLNILTDMNAVALMRKYKDVIKDGDSFKNELLNPKDINFCKLLTIQTKDRPLNDLDDLYYTLQENHNMIICIGSFGKNEVAKKICQLNKNDKPWSSWKMICQGGSFFKSINDIGNKDDFFNNIGYVSFQQGLGVVTANTNFKLSDYMGSPMDGTTIGEYNIDAYLAMKNAVENLKPINFCDSIQRYKEECNKIIGQ